MKTYIKSVFILYVINIVTAQVVIPKPCPAAQVVPAFETSNYLGKWYEIEKYYAAFEKGGKCITAVYGTNDNGSISVTNSQIDIESGKLKTAVGYAVLVPSNFDAKLEVTFPESHKYEKEQQQHLNVNKSEGNYWVLGTDYVNYSVVWSCTPAGPNSIQFAWVLARERELAPSVQQKVREVFDRNGIDRNLLQATDNTNCTN